MQWAAINNRVAIVQELIDRGADVNATGGFLKETALGWAVRQGALEAVVALVQNGADPHLMGTEGLNAFHLALQFKHADTVLFLSASHRSLLDAPTVSGAGKFRFELDQLLTVPELLCWLTCAGNRESKLHASDVHRAPVGQAATKQGRRAKNDGPSPRSHRFRRECPCVLEVIR
jgi:hypothetical protein